MSIGSSLIPHLAQKRYFTPVSTVKKLFLDDIRKPPDSSWIVVRSYDAFVAHIEEFGVPDVISFDHDLAFEHYPFADPSPTQEFRYGQYKEKTGYECAKWLLESGYKLKEWQVHSMNTVGAENIRKLITGWEPSKQRAIEVGHWDAEFHAFQKLSHLAERLLPGVKSYTADQCDAIHEFARILAQDLTSGEYVYDKKRHGG